jgi:hypothetical protein
MDVVVNPTDSIMVPLDFVLFTTLILALSPSQPDKNCMQGSLAPTDAAVVLVGRMLLMGWVAMD